MSATVLPAAWQGQWLRLRALRVERARAAVRVAEQAQACAQAAVDERQRRIARAQSAMVSLSQGWTGARSAALPRWSTTVCAWREVLCERLERDEYALIDDERALEEALDKLHDRRAELMRAMAREQAVGELVQRSRHQAACLRERCAEREQDDARRMAPALPGALA